MKIKILLVVLVVVIFLVGCSEVVNTDRDISMVLVAKHNGIEVWRFLDNAGPNVYYCYVSINTRDLLVTPVSIACP